MYAAGRVWVNATIKLKVWVILFFVLYFFSSYIEFTNQLSVEAAEYQSIVNTLQSGLSLKFFFQKSLLLIGNMILLIGMGVVFLRGYVWGKLVLVGGVLMAIGSILGMPPAMFPPLDPPLARFTWLATASIWGGIIVFSELSLPKKR